MLKGQFSSQYFVRINMVASQYFFCRATLVRILHPAILFFWIFNFWSISWKAHKILHPRKTLFIPNLLSFNVGDNSHRFSSISLPFCSKSPPFLVTKNLSTAHPYSLVFHLGFLLIGFYIAELLLIMFYFCFPFGFARLGIDTGGGRAPLAQYIYIF